MSRRNHLQHLFLTPVSKAVITIWAGLIDCSEGPEEGKSRFRVRARKKLNANNTKKVLDYLMSTAENIRFHFKSFRRYKEDDPIRLSHGFTDYLAVWPEDPAFELDWEKLHCYGWRGGKPTAQAEAFDYMWLNVDRLVGLDMSNNDWLDSTISQLRASILQFAGTIGHEFAHAMVKFTLRERPEPQMNEERITETGYSWENFVFGGTLEEDADCGWIVTPWPDGYIGNSVQLCGRSGRGAHLPLQCHPPYERTWERFFEQRFWDEPSCPGGAFKKLWLHEHRVDFNQSYFADCGELSVPHHESVYA